MRSILMLNAVTRCERNAATSFVFDSINARGGWVDDVHMYSNKMTNIRFVLEAGDIEPFLAALADYGIRLDAPAERFAPDDHTERKATLQLSFVHDEPDLRREIPAVPG
ncbi:hypothetical protein [Ciceribacter thiooxidans]|uniref:Uncharacterized protein n=1 Tax=Ciceribacter thiooxidans TaxID=1969821 RepID=A0ABV7HZ10_9HYPH|nr:hypothetical protein [Ciceribacter thiooxidans]